MTKKAEAICLLIVGLGLASNCHSQSSLTNGLVAYYPFHGNANDESGNHDDGAVAGAVLGTDRFGRPRDAYYFNATNLSRIACAGSHLPLGAASRTISLWIRPDDLPVDTSFIPKDLLQYGTFNNANGGIYLEFVYQTTAGMVTPAMGADSPSTQWNKWISDWNFARWRHLVWVMESPRASLYIDGITQPLTTTPPSPVGVNTVAGPLYLGYGENRHFDGLMDDVRIYDRALSPAEVAQLYAEEATPPPGFETNGLVAYYPFDGNANDASGNHDNGVVHGAILREDRFGQANKAYYFNATNLSRIECAGTNLPQGGGPRTISLWIRPDDLALNTSFIAKELLQYGTFNNANGGLYLEFVYQNEAGLVTPALGADSPSMQWNQWIPNWDFRRWRHLTWVAGGSTTATFYLDGVAQSLTTYPGSPAQLNTVIGPLYLGYGEGRYFDGLMDEVRIYDRALTPEEVAQLHGMESGPQVNLAKAVRPIFSFLWVGTQYQLQISSDLNTWNNHGSPFSATNSRMVYPQYFDVDNWGDLFFRLR